jgi:hypothetical protein
MSRRTREICRNLVKQFEKSGKTREEFAAERQIPVGTLLGECLLPSSPRR